VVQEGNTNLVGNKWIRAGGVKLKGDIPSPRETKLDSANKTTSIYET